MFRRPSCRSYMTAVVRVAPRPFRAYYCVVGAELCQLTTMVGGVTSNLGFELPRWPWHVSKVGARVCTCGQWPTMVCVQGAFRIVPSLSAPDLRDTGTIRRAEFVVPSPRTALAFGYLRPWTLSRRDESSAMLCLLVCASTRISLLRLTTRYCLTVHKCTDRSVRWSLC